MGYLQALEMARMADRATAIRWHLQSNHFPPVHEAFIPVAEEAIDLALVDEWDEILAMPNGRSLMVREIIEGLHLDAFLEDDDGICCD